MSDEPNSNSENSGGAGSKAPPPSMLGRFHKLIEAKSQQESFPAWSFIFSFYFGVFAIVVSVSVSYFFSSSDAPLREDIDNSTKTIIDLIRPLSALISKDDGKSSPTVVASPNPLMPDAAVIIEPTKREFLSHGRDALSFGITVRRPVWIYCLVEDISGGTAMLLFPANSSTSGAGATRLHMVARLFQPGAYTFPSIEFGLDDPNLLKTSEPGDSRLLCLSRRERATDVLERQWLDRTLPERRSPLPAVDGRQLIERFGRAGFEVTVADAATVSEATGTKK